MISVLRKIKMSSKQVWAAFIFVAIATVGQLLAPSMNGKYAELYNSQFA